MASKKSTKRREEEKKRAQMRAQEQQRRQKQAKPSMTPSDLVTGFSADMLAIMQHFQSARMHVKQRITQAEMMKEQNPERFNTLRIDAFKNLGTRMDELQKQIDAIAGLVGTLEDLQTMHDKMIFVSQNFGSMTEMQISLDSFMRELQDIDATFNKTLVELITPEAVTDPNVGLEFPTTGSEVDRTSEVDIPVTESEAQAIMAEQTTPPIQDAEMKSVEDNTSAQ